MADDISKQTVFVLVVLTLLISILGTWTVLSQMPQGVVAPVGEGRETSGTVSLRINPPVGGEPESATGQVIFKINPPPKS